MIITVIFFLTDMTDIYFSIANLHLTCMLSVEAMKYELIKITFFKNCVCLRNFNPTQKVLYSGDKIDL